MSEQHTFVYVILAVPIHVVCIQLLVSVCFVTAFSIVLSSLWPFLRTVRHVRLLKTFDLLFTCHVFKGG